MKISKRVQNGIEVLNMESRDLVIALVPALGGKILSVLNKPLQKEFLWTNKNLPLNKNASGADYDSNFFGGIDELIPNDIPEKIDSIDYHDHGELWTTFLQYEITGEEIITSGQLALSGLSYSKTVSLDAMSPVIHLNYSIHNRTDQARHFLWKLHAALNIQRGDKLGTTAKRGKVVDAAYSRFKKDLSEFEWPIIENTDASIIPEINNTMDFFYLYDTAGGEMQLASENDQHLFSYRYDKNIFPYQWYFASYGGFLDHCTAILEPCTNMPMSVNEAMEKKQCAVLHPGQTLRTTVEVFAGEKKYYSPT